MFSELFWFCYFLPKEDLRVLANEGERLCSIFRKNMASSRKIGRVVDDESKQAEHENNNVSDNAESDDAATDESENEFMDQVWIEM